MLKGDAVWKRVGLCEKGFFYCIMTSKSYLPLETSDRQKNLLIFQGGGGGVAAVSM